MRPRWTSKVIVMKRRIAHSPESQRHLPHDSASRHEFPLGATLPSSPTIDCDALITSSRSPAARDPALGVMRTPPHLVGGGERIRTVDLCVANVHALSRHDFATSLITSADQGIRFASSSTVEPRSQHFDPRLFPAVLPVPGYLSSGAARRGAITGNYLPANRSPHNNPRPFRAASQSAMMSSAWRGPPSSV
jgi:hypothetical protein